MIGHFINVYLISNVDYALRGRGTERPPLLFLLFINLFVDLLAMRYHAVMDVHVLVGPIKLQVSPRLPTEDFNILKKHLSYVMHNYEYTAQHKLHGWDGRKTLLYKNQMAPAGCLYRLVNLMKKHLGYTVTITHKNNYKPEGEATVIPFDLEEFQQTAVMRAVKYRRGIIQAPVRAGKTAIASAIINRIHHFPVWVVTNGKDLVIQTKLDLEEHLGMPVGVFTEGVFSPEDIVVSSYQALGRAVSDAKKWKNTSIQSSKLVVRNKAVIKHLQSAKVVLFDECHHALSPKNKGIANEALSAGYVLGLSGTPKPDKANRLELEAAIGSIIFRVKYETLIKHKRIARPKIVLYDLPYKWFAKGLREHAEIYNANIVDNIYRNTFIAEIANKLKKAGKTIFIMIRKLDHGPILRSLISGSVFVHGGISGDDRKQLYKGIQDKRIKCIIGTVGKEGLNIPSLDAVINAEGYKSSIATTQKMRSLTASAGKKYGIIVDFIDRGKFIAKHSKKRLKIYTAIKEAKMIKIKVSNEHFDMESSRWSQ